MVLSKRAQSVGRSESVRVRLKAPPAITPTYITFIGVLYLFWNYCVLPGFQIIPPMRAVEKERVIRKTFSGCRVVAGEIITVAAAIRVKATPRPFDLWGHIPGGVQNATFFSGVPSCAGKWRRRVIPSVAANWSLQIDFWQQISFRHMQVITQVEISCIHVWSAI